MDLSRWPRDTPYPQNFALASPTSSGRSVDIVRSQTQQATDFSFSFYEFMEFMGPHISNIFGS
jgi:hypothetical protein